MRRGEVEAVDLVGRVARFHAGGLGEDIGLQREVDFGAAHRAVATAAETVEETCRKRLMGTGKGRNQCLKPVRRLESRSQFPGSDPSPRRKAQRVEPFLSTGRGLLVARWLWDARASQLGYSELMERQVSIRLPTPLLNELDRRARRRRRPRADVIRAALAAYIALPDGALEEYPAERVRDLLGSVQGLPADLASNANQYLADLGGRRR